MTAARKPGFVVPLAVILAVLLGLYVGAYYATVKRGMGRDFDGVYQPYYHEWPRSRLAFPDRRPIFSPVHWLDRRIRPHVWEPAE